MNERTEQTADEKRAVGLLKRCGFAPASWDKRFVRQLHEDTLTAKERPQVWRLFIRYRAQIQRLMVTSGKRSEWQAQAGRFQILLHEAALLAAPDFRKAERGIFLKAKIAEIQKRKNDLTAESAENTKPVAPAVE